VTRLDDLPPNVPGGIRFCVQRGGQRTLFRARGPIQLERPLMVAPDTTIDGRPLAPGDAPVTITGDAQWLVMIENSGNVIVRNLFFRVPNRGPSCSNPQTPKDTIHCGIPLYLRGATRNVWIDHNDFDRCGEKCITIWTGRMLPGMGRAEAPDLVTISNNRFTNSYFGIQIGSAAQLGPGQLPGAERVTLYGNVFSNVFRRTPQAASFAQVHAFNNLIVHWGHPGRACQGTDYGFAASSLGGAQLLLENNVFVPWSGPVGCKVAGLTEQYSPLQGYQRGSGYLRGRGNTGGEVKEQSPAQVFRPPYPYTLRPVAGLAEQIRREAGVEGYPRPPLQ
jgi:pectate lyase